MYVDNIERCTTYSVVHVGLHADLWFMQDFVQIHEILQAFFVVVQIHGSAVVPRGTFLTARHATECGGMCYMPHLRSESDGTPRIYIRNNIPIEAILKI